MLRRVSGKGTSVVVSGCGQTVSFRQDGLWQHNGLVVGRKTELPVLCGEGLPKLDGASERHVVTFCIKSLSVCNIKQDNDIVLTQLCFRNWIF